MKKLKAEAYIHATLEWIATLGKVFTLARSRIIHGKGVVIGVRKVLAPQIQLHLAQIEGHMRTQYGINILTITVGVIPINFALHVDVGTQNHAAQETGIKLQAIICHRRESVLRHVRHLLILVAHGLIAFAIRIFVKLSSGVTIIQHPVEMAGGKLSAQGSLDAAAVAITTCLIRRKITKR